MTTMVLGKSQDIFENKSVEKEVVTSSMTSQGGMQKKKNTIDLTAAEGNDNMRAKLRLVPIELNAKGNEVLDETTTIVIPNLATREFQEQKSVEI